MAFDSDHYGYAVTPASPTTTATYGYDLLDRVTSRSDTTSSGTSDYNALGQATTSTYSAGGSTTTTTYDYADASAVYQLGQIAKATSTQGSNTQTSTYTYAWYDAPVRSYTSVSGTGAQTNGTSTATFDAWGRTVSVVKTGGSAGTTSFAYDAASQILDGLTYRMAGREMWSYGGRFDPRGGDAGGGTYAAQAGDTLTSVAAAIWGDGNLWYKLAEANGLSAGASLGAGQALKIPVGVWRSQQTAATFRPYDPGTIGAGEADPLYPTASAPKGSKCGVFGQILLLAVAAAVTYFTAGAAAHALGPILGGAFAGAAGSVASQVVGLATGIQDKFSWKGVAIAAIAGGVTGGLGPKGPFGANGVFGSVKDGVFTAGAIGIKDATLSAAIGASVSNAVSQGIGLATGLQSKFDFAGVAAAGIGSAFGNKLSGAMGSKGGFFATTLGSDIAYSTASTLANAATRSAIEGSNFGDNIKAAIPDAIGGIIGRVLGRAGQSVARNIAADKAARDPTTIVVNEKATAAALARVFGSDLPSVSLDLGNSPETRILLLLYSGQISPSAAAILRSEVNTIKTQLRADYLANTQPGSMPIATADHLPAQPVGGSDVAISMFELNSWRERAYQVYIGGDVQNGAKVAYSTTYYNDVVKGYDANEALIQKWDTIANAEVNKLLFVGIGGPALAAGGVVASAAVAGYAGSLYVGGTASTIASGTAGFVTGGTFGAGFEFTKNRAFGLPDTAGGYTTAIVGGGLGGTGLRLLPSTILGRAVSARAQTVALGGASGFSGELSGQLVTNGGNLLQIDGSRLGLATGLGGVLGAVTPLEVRFNGFTSGRNSSLSLYQGLNTRLNNSNIVQMQLRYPANNGAANAVRGSGQQAVGATLDGIKQRVGR